MVILENQVALITGAGSGIGAATAIHFAALKCCVAINGRTVDKLQKTLEQCLGKGLSPHQVLVVVGDISQEEVSKGIVDRTLAHFGRLDILINNAVIPGLGTLEATKMDEWDISMNTNLRAVFLLMKLCAPHLKKTQGNIVNISSVFARIVFPGCHSGSAAKAGLDHLTKTVARELAADNIRVNVIELGCVLTEYFDKLNLKEEEILAILERLKKMHAMNRVADPSEIAKPIAFLASDDASFVTGSVFVVDGGMSLMTGS